MDLIKGYTFVTAEKNVTHTKLNNLVDLATIATTFHTGHASAGTDPASATTEVMLYDSVSTTYKKATLAALVFDHAELLSTRVSSKTIPIAADFLLLADSAASNAYKKVTVGNLIFGAAAHPNPSPTGVVAADKIPIYDTVTSSVRTITWAALIGGLQQVGSVDGAESFMVLTNAGALRRTTLAALASNLAAVSTTVSGVNQILLFQGTTPLRLPLAEVIDRQAAYTTLSGIEQLLVGTGATLTQKITTTNFKKFVHKGYGLWRDEKVAGTPGGTLSVGGGVRNLNTADAGNTLTAPIASDAVTLPAGTYRYRATAPFSRTDEFQVRLSNSSLGTVVAYGTNGFNGNIGVTGSMGRSEVSGRFTIAIPQAFKVAYYIGASRSTDDGGRACGNGLEVYSTLEFWQED